jgi:K+-transporting ATPase ATPase C chain
MTSGGAMPFVPDDLVMASASGLDPEISIKAALFQTPRVAKTRGISDEELCALIYHMEERTLLGLFPRRVNVLQLNCELDRHYGTGNE